MGCYHLPHSIGGVHSRIILQGYSISFFPFDSDKQFWAGLIPSFHVRCLVKSLLKFFIIPVPMISGIEGFRKPFKIDTITDGIFVHKAALTNFSTIRFLLLRHYFRVKFAPSGTSIKYFVPIINLAFVGSSCGGEQTWHFTDNNRTAVISNFHPAVMNLKPGRSLTCSIKRLAKAPAPFFAQTAVEFHIAKIAAKKTKSVAHYCQHF